MRFQLKYRALKYLISTLLILVFFQNCTVGRPVEFTDSALGKVSQIGQHNGDGYLGKPPPGEYIRSLLDHQCLGSASSERNLQGRMLIDSQNAMISQDNCQDFSYPVSWNDPRWDYLAYNPDFFGMGLAIYEKSASFKADNQMAVESFCRLADQTEGLDIIAKIDSNKEVSVKVYTGKKVGEAWESRVVPSFAVQRNSSAKEVTYTTEGFDLVVDVLNPKQSFFTARLKAKIDGKWLEKSMNCRQMREDSAIQYSPTGLVGLWQMNGNFLDISGLNNHLTPFDTDNTLSFQTGPYQQAIQLDGANDHMRANASPSLNNLPQLTVATWIWPEDQGGGSTHGGIVHKSDKPWPVTQGWQFGFGAQTRGLYFNAAFSGGGLYLNGGGGSSPLVLNAWNHVAVTWDGSNLASGVKFYINGSPGVVGGFNDGIGTRVDDSQLPLHLGHFNDYEFAWFRGQMDQTSVWNRQLTPQEIQNLYRTGSPSL